MPSPITARLVACMLALVLGWILHPSSARAQEDGIEVQIRVAPKVLSLQSTGKVVTVHTDLPYSWVDGASVTLSGIEIQSWKSDARGYFVAKFSMDEVKNLAISGKSLQVITLILEGFSVEDDYFVGKQGILVIDILPRG